MTRRNGQREAVVRLRIGDARDVVGHTPVEAPTELGVVADTDEYRFHVDGDAVASAVTRYLSTEGPPRSWVSSSVHTRPGTEPRARRMR